MRRRLVRSYAACLNPGTMVILPPNGGTRHAAQHGDLADVRERVRDGSLKQLLLGLRERSVRGEVGFEAFQCGKEALDLPIPREGCRIVPLLFAFGHGERPIEQIADMRQDADRRAYGFAALVGAKFGLSAAHGFPATVGQGGDGVAKEISFGVGCHQGYYGKHGDRCAEG